MMKQRAALNFGSIRIFVKIRLKLWDFPKFCKHTKLFQSEECITTLSFDSQSFIFVLSFVSLYKFLAVLKFYAKLKNIKGFWDTLGKE